MPKTLSRRTTPDDTSCNWFHPDTNREESEQKLRTAGFSEGLFLVRESSSNKLDFVLSVVHNNQVIHYQIRKFGEDALFSLGDNVKVIHGLDQLITFFESNQNTGLEHQLTDYVEGICPPSETMLHGTQNLLHRATSEGNQTIVTELLASGYRNLLAKDPDSRTALHLAVIHKQEDILLTLLKYRANVNVSDSSGASPLHYAASQKDSLVFLKILLSVGSANPTMRNDITDWIPLHEAASRGELENVLCLLDHKSPAKPRTGRNETPADLARAAGHHEVAAFIDSYPLEHPDTDRTEWYHPNLDRQAAIEKLKLYGAENGTFLIRNHQKKKRFFVISLIWKKKSHHFEIEKQGIYYFVDEGPYLPSLEHLVQHYSRFSDGLPCTLSIPVGCQTSSSKLSSCSPSSTSISAKFDANKAGAFSNAGFLPSPSSPMSPTDQIRSRNFSTTTQSTLLSPTDFSSNLNSSSINKSTSSSSSTLKTSFNPFAILSSRPEGMLSPPTTLPAKPVSKLPSTPVLNLPLPLQPHILSDLTLPEADRINANTLEGSMPSVPPRVPTLIPAVPPRVPAKGFPLAYPSNLKTIDPRVYANNDTLRRVRHSKDKIPREAIELVRILGEGEFGDVYQGIYITEDGVYKDVAVKALSNDNIQPNQNEEFLREAKIMMSLNHQCIVQLVGVSHGPPILMVLELVPLGSMLDYLVEHPGSVSPDMEIRLWASQIACGMLYLQQKKFVHRDLAARNILLASKYQTKISDFGLSRAIGDKDYYRSASGGRWPVKWYAPECINFGSFTHASDVWSYGIVLWEMFSYGKQPYEDKTSVQTVEYIEEGHRLPQPEYASNDVYDLMLKCWQHNPNQRPGFDEIFKLFSDSPEYQNLTELLMTQDFQQLGM